MSRIRSGPHEAVSPGQTCRIALLPPPRSAATTAAGLNIHLIRTDTPESCSSRTVATTRLANTLSTVSVLQRRSVPLQKGTPPNRVRIQIANLARDSDVNPSGASLRRIPYPWRELMSTDHNPSWDSTTVMRLQTPRQPRTPIG
ncbi:hypothetical protein PWT90_11242 [Aphanocladium album]|nr:hypothetical protein PWT90_11242 [Aphanocladium album]